MSHTKTLLASFVASLSFSSASYAWDGLDLYDCVISDKDRVTSTGVKLTRAQDILAQDRANYHKFKRRDAKDSGDSTFVTAEGRKLWQSAKVTIDPALKEKIISGGEVEIKVFILTEDMIDVHEGLLDPNVG